MILAAMCAAAPNARQAAAQDALAPHAYQPGLADEARPAPAGAHDLPVTDDGGDARQPRPPARLPRKPVWPLRVVSWHLDAAQAAGAIEINPTPPRAWRHTFGAERYSPPQARLDIAQLDADVVLLQGVRLISHIRLLFPARQWRVIVSRQVLRPVLAPREAGPGWGELQRTPTTAIAVRYQRGVRIAGQDHILETALPATNASGPPETAAALAVRLRVDGETVWLLSADLRQPCVEPGGVRIQSDLARACLALARWYELRRSGARVVLGGPHAPTALVAPGAPEDPACPKQMIAALRTGVTVSATSPPAPPPGGYSPATPASSTGCMARLDLPAMPPRPR